MPFESYLIHTLQGNTEAAAAAKAEMKALMRGAVHSYLEYAIDYASAGMYEEATQLLSFVAEGNEATYPMVYYALGYFASKMGKKDEALNLYKKAETMCPDYCFPNKLEEVLMLNDAMSLNPEGAKAPYYLGNFHYAARIYDEAIACWENQHLSMIRILQYCVTCHWLITTNSIIRRRHWLHWKSLQFGYYRCTYSDGARPALQETSLSAPPALGLPGSTC